MCVLIYVRANNWRFIRSFHGHCSIYRAICGKDIESLSDMHPHIPKGEWETVLVNCDRPNHARMEEGHSCKSRTIPCMHAKKREQLAKPLAPLTCPSSHACNVLSFSNSNWEFRLLSTPIDRARTSRHEVDGSIRTTGRHISRSYSYIYCARSCGVPPAVCRARGPFSAVWCRWDGKI